ncbi:MAG: hypothetical protein ACKOU6_10730, partial [Planctomycetota bacterium]
MKPVELIQRIREIVTSPTYRPVKIRVLASKLGLEDSERRALRVTVRKLVRQGRLAYGPNHLVLPVTTLDSQQLTPPPAELAVPASESEWESESEGMESESEGLESTETEFEDPEAAESEMGETSSEPARAA